MIVVSGGLDCFLVKWNLNDSKKSKTMNLGKIIYEQYDKSVKICNPPHVYSILYDPTSTHYIAGLGNGSVCSIKRKTVKIVCYKEIHNQRIVDTIIAKHSDTWLLITASNDLTLGISLYEAKDAQIKLKINISIEDLPNAIMYNENHQAIYVADTSNDIKLINFKL